MKRLRILIFAVLFIITPLFSGNFVGAVVETDTLVTITSPASGTITADNQVVRGTAPAGETIAIIIDGGYVDSVTADSESHWTYVTTGLSIGSHTIQALWPKNYFAFVSNLNDRNISVTETLTDTHVVDFSIDLSAQLQDVVLTPDHTKAYILDSNLDNLDNLGKVWAADVVGLEVGNEPLNDGGIYPYAGASSNGGDKIYVVNHDSANLSVINTADDSIDGPYELSGAIEPVDIAVNPTDGNKAYIADHGGESGNGSVLLLNLSNNTVSRSISTACPVNSIVFSPDGTKAYMSETCVGPSKVEVINTETDTIVAVIDDIGTAESYPQSIAITSDGAKLLVVDYEGNALTLINTSNNSIIDILDVGINPTAVAVNYNDTKAYVTNYGSNDVSVINLVNNTVNTSPISVGDGPNGLGILEDLYYSKEVNFTIVEATTPTIPATPINSISDVIWTTSDQTEDTLSDSPPINHENTNNNQTNNTTYAKTKDTDNTKNRTNYWLWFGFSLLFLLIIYIIYRIYKKIKTEKL